MHQSERRTSRSRVKPRISQLAENNVPKTRHRIGYRKGAPKRHRKQYTESITPKIEYAILYNDTKTIIIMNFTDVIMTT